jgi:hypothetical protein
MNSKREKIESFRKKLQETGADSTYTNQFLYNTLMEHGRWLIRREISAGRIYRSTTLFRTLGCQQVVEDSVIESCCPIKTNCKIYRTKNKLPNIWVDEYGPIIKAVTSVDGSTDFFITTPNAWQNKRDDPYQKMSKQMYVFFSDGYLWFPEHNPHLVNIPAFWVDDISRLDDCSDCVEDKECVRFLDTEFMIPGWLESEMFSKAISQLMPSKQLPEDMDINKNQTRKN